MQITEYKAELMFQILLQDCFQNVDDNRPPHIPYLLWNPVNNSWYRVQLYRQMVEHELLSVATYSILIKMTH